MTSSPVPKLTDAGRKLLQKYLDDEAQGRLVLLRNGEGETFYGIELRTGDGGQKAAAERLQRDGLAKMQWQRSQGLHRGRYLWITDAGRAAMTGSKA